MAEIANEALRRRGRPAGKNRIPLSIEERRYRNANYERQRRQETSEAMAELAEAAGCDPSLNNADILATVISQLQGATQSSNMIEDMKIMNEKLTFQIEILEQRLLEGAVGLKKRRPSKGMKTAHYESPGNHIADPFLNEPIEIPPIKGEEFKRT